MILVNKRFHDLEEYAFSANSWNVDFRQLDCGSFSAYLLQVNLGNFHFLHTRFNRHIIQQGGSPPNLYTFGLPSDSSRKIIWRGKELPKNSMMVFSPGMEIDGVTWPGFNVYSLSLPLVVLENLSRISGYPDVRNLICDTNVLTCNPSVIGKFLQLLRLFCSKIMNGRSTEAKQELYQKFNEEILEQFLAGVVTSRPVKYYDSSRLRDRALKKAINYISEFSQECPTVEMICQETGVSKRTLEYAFLERFGVSPKTYLRAFRLNGVWRELSRSDPFSTKVKEAANHWGFWHMGQFATDFKKFFGELPSETLRKP